MKRLIGVTLALAPVLSTYAHHSFFGRFDTTTTIELVVDDPVNFTEPVTLTKTLLYVPDVELIPFDCTVIE